MKIFIQLLFSVLIIIISIICAYVLDTYKFGIGVRSLLFVSALYGFIAGVCLLSYTISKIFKS